MTRKFTVVGNWKMHGSKAHLKEFVAAIAESKVLSNSQSSAVVCPPFPYLETAAALMATTAQALQLGAQDVSAHQLGAFTGQVEANMLIEVGCKYVIVGHSERRQYNNETDEQIAEKFLSAKAAGLIPILCVGETKEQRLAQQTDEIIVGQLQALLKSGIGVFENAIIAYEPIWAIGTGLTATPEQAQAVHLLLRQTLAEYDAALANNLSILYGGSVKANNAQGLFAMPDIDGALVGGASLNANEFIQIIAAGA